MLYDVVIPPNRFHNWLVYPYCKITEDDYVLWNNASIRTFNTATSFKEFGWLFFPIAGSY